jgi:deoxyribodipyrimidine photo-lyase
LDSFLTQRGETYRGAMSSPLTGERACSRLSPHLAWGTLSIREVAQTTTARQGIRPGGRWGGALASFQSRLAWRDHFIQKLEAQPSIEDRDLHPLAVMRPRDSDAARLGAWVNGETGLPFLDACLRYLQATGWLNFRMRAMVTSVASYHLWLDWRVTGQHLARMFTDYEPGIHWPQVQMQSGTTGINIPRIYNPVKQGLDQDPTGAFTRAWVPELVTVPDAFLQTPWAWPEGQRLIAGRYPEPIIDVAAAAREARDRIWKARQAAGFAETAAGIVRRHASRADPRFVNDRAPRRRPPPAAQLTLDL